MKSKDTIRLDWLQKSGALVHRLDTPEGLYHVWIPAASCEGYFYDRTVRRVIDKAMKGRDAEE